METMTLTGRLATILVLCATSGCYGEEALKQNLAEKELADAATAERKNETTKVDYAQSVWITQPETGDMFAASDDVEVMESMPLQFAISIFEKSGGMKFELDEIGKPDADGVLIAKLTYNGPSDGGKEGARLRLALGALKIGKYEIQLHVRMRDGDKHEVKQTLEFTAR
jgi:hypothetical protein